MLRSVGCNYVLVGHSERREYFKETKEQLTAKIKQAHTNDLIPVFCFGEKLVERKSKIHFEVVGQQLKDVLNNFEEKDLKKIILAYEPVWAIGTGETATPAQAQEMHAYIRQTIKEMFTADAAMNISILYGGSCNAQNAHELFSCPDVDGGLIGGASLKADDFCKIIYSF
jgi:triosephosphate isomerase